MTIIEAGESIGSPGSGPSQPPVSTPPPVVGEEPIDPAKLPIGPPGTARSESEENGERKIGGYQISRGIAPSAPPEG